jgi:hypothetical protein
LEALQREWGNSVQPLKKADTSATYPFGAINFIPALGINFQISKNNLRRWLCNFKRLSQDGGRNGFF